MAALVTPTIINASKNGDIDKVFEDTVEIYIDFSNQNSRIDDVERNKHDQFFGARLFVSALRTGSNVVYFKSDLSHHKNFFRDQLITYDWLINQNVFDPYLVMQVISTTYHRFKNISQDCTLPVVIVYDEMQTILEVLGDNAFHRCKSFLPSYICNSSGANLLLQRDNLLVIPVHAGTLTNSLISFGPTSFIDFRLPLPPLNEDDVIKILEDKCKAEDNFTMEQLDHIWLKRYFLVTGLIPRHLNAAFTITKQKLTGKKISDQVVRDIITATDANILTMTKKDFSVMYTDTEEHDRQLIFCAVSGTLLNQTDEWVVKMIHRGKLYFTAKGHVYLPHCFFSQLLLHYNDECLMLHNYIPLITDKVGCVQVKQMCATLLSLHINEILKSGKNICSLSELFPSNVISGKQIIQLKYVEVVTLVNNLLATIITEGISLKYECIRILTTNTPNLQPSLLF
jgi:hypothetical protein